jgi:hypothetical protein
MPGVTHPARAGHRRLSDEFGTVGVKAIPGLPGAHGRRADLSGPCLAPVQP